MQWLHIPPRIRAAAEALPPPKTDFIDGFYRGESLRIQGAGERASVYAAQVLLHLVSAHRLSGRWVNANQYVQMIKDSFDNDGLLGDEYSSPYVFKNIKQVFDVLVIDDLGGEYVARGQSDKRSEFAKYEIRDLLIQRHNLMKTTIITSSLIWTDLRVRYSLNDQDAWLFEAIDHFQWEML